MAAPSIDDQKNPFLAFVGIDFGTDGSGLAYGLPDGNAYIHNMWDDVDARQKPKTSVLFDDKSTVIRVGTGAQDMYLGCTQDKGWKLFERFKMNLYEEPTTKGDLKSIATKMQFVELKDQIETTNNSSVKESSSKVFIAQLQYLREQAFKFIHTHLRARLKLIGNIDKGWPQIQYFLTVPAIWSDKAKDQMVKWAISAGLIDGSIKNQLKIVYEPDCASLSIQHAIIRSMKGIKNPKALGSKKKKKKKKKKLQSLVPKVDINIPLSIGDKYILLDTGGGTCDVACHESMGKFSIAEVLHPSGGKWGATYIDQRFIGLLGELFSKDLLNIFQMAEKTGRQSYLKFLHYFLNEAKLKYYDTYDENDVNAKMPEYHDIQMPANFVNFVVTQFAAELEGTGNNDAMDTLGAAVEKGLNALNKRLNARSQKYRKPKPVVNPSNDNNVVEGVDGSPNAVKGSKLVTAGVKTEDLWNMADDYTQWTTNHLAEWVTNLNDDFDDYGDVITYDFGLTGNDFNTFQLSSFWKYSLGIQNQNHIKALVAAATNRIAQYKILKKTSNNNNIASAVPAAPAAPAKKKKKKKRDWMIKIIEIADDDDDDDNSDSDSNSDDDIEYEEDYLFSVHNDIWEMMFNVIVNPIIDHCKKILLKNEMKNAKYIFLVGGFANSKYFQMKMKKSFSNHSNLSVVMPALPGLCVVDGAARYGLTESFVRIRRLQKSYGIKIGRVKSTLDLTLFPNGYVDKHTWDDPHTGITYIEDCFSAFVKKGDAIKLGDAPFTKKVQKATKTQTRVDIVIYSSDKGNPMTTTPIDATRLSNVLVEMPKDKDYVMVEFSFSTNVLTVYAYPADDPTKKKKCGVDFL